MACGVWSRFAEHVGTVPVSIPSSEKYTGLDAGSLVGAAHALDSSLLSDVDHTDTPLVDSASKDRCSDHAFGHRVSTDGCCPFA